MITVCSLAHLPETVRRTGARRLVTLISAGTLVPRPPEIAEDDHLFLSFHDITTPAEGMTPPGEAHVRQLLDFVADWDGTTPMVIHCFAGISRSTAAAYITACALRPDACEAGLATALRSASASATPNARLVAIADRLLDRDGRMIDGIRAIGRGADAFQGAPFTVPLEPVPVAGVER